MRLNRILSRRRRPSRGRFAPRVQALEPRTLLATFIVTSPLDDGPGTLRAAVAEANALPGADSIVFDLPAGSDTITLSSGPLEVTDSLTIEGPGSTALTISAEGTSSLFVISPADPEPTTPALDVEIAGLTLADGRVFGDDSGGAISAFMTNLTVSGSVFEGNVSDRRGGAIFADTFLDTSSFPFVASEGSLTVVGSTFRGNRAEVGGAIFAATVPSTIISSTFEENTALFVGGAISYQAPSGSDAFLTVESSDFESNRADNEFSFAFGGAISVNGRATISGSSFVGNVVAAPGAAIGGAIRVGFGGELAIEGSHFGGNQALAVTGNEFASGFAEGGAVAGEFRTSLSIAGSTFVGNRAEGLREARGGAVSNSGEDSFFSVAPMVVSRSTFVGNEAIGRDRLPNGFQAGTASGGALYNSTGPLIVNGSVFQNNRAKGGSGGESGAGGLAIGGGVANQTSTLTLSNSTFLGNRAEGGATGISGFPGLAVGGGLADDFNFPNRPASTLTNVVFVGNVAQGGTGLGGATGAQARGGGLSAGNIAVLSGVTVVNNRAIGGDGSSGGDAFGGGLNVWFRSATVEDSTFANNRAEGGAALSTGGSGGTGRGGGIASESFVGGLVLRRSNLAANRAIGGNGTVGGDAQGGGLWIVGLAALEHSLIVGNFASAAPGGIGAGGGVYVAPGSMLAIDHRTRIVGNRASTIGNNLFESP